MPARAYCKVDVADGRTIEDACGRQVLRSCRKLDDKAASISKSVRVLCTRLLVVLYSEYVVGLKQRLVGGPDGNKTAMTCLADDIHVTARLESPHGPQGCYLA
jgi:hypothetical protein